MSRSETESRNRQSRPVDRVGFSLIELIITMLIVGIMGAIAAPKFHDSLSYHRANSAAMRIVADLKLAREYAKSTSADQTVTFSLGTDSYSITPGLTDLDRSSQPYEVTVSDAPFQASLISANFGGTATVTFNGFGAPDDGGQVVVQVGSHQVTVLLNVETGEATIQ